MPVSSSISARAADRSSSRWPAIAACSVRSGRCPARRSSKAARARVARDEKTRRFQPSTLNSYLFILTRFLHANRYPLRWKTLYYQDLSEAEARDAVAGSGIHRVRIERSRRLAAVRDRTGRPAGGGAQRFPAVSYTH